MTDEERFIQLIGQSDGYTDDQVKELRAVAAQVGNLGTTWREKAHFRASVETIAAIKQFDRVSANLIDRTNVLTGWMLGFTILASLLGGGALWISYLTYRLARSSVGK